MSIVVNGVIHSDAKSIDALREAILEMQRASLGEAGCREYAFSVDLADPEKLRITELWDSTEALREHFATPHMAAFQQAIAAHPPRATAVGFFEASQIEMPR